MTMSPAELRTRAADCIAQAREAGPKRAAQLRASAKAYRRQALEVDLFEHGKAVGRGNVTPSSFAQHLRTLHSTQQPSPTASD